MRSFVELFAMMGFLSVSPSMVSRGRFRLRLRHDRADRFKCFALGIDGTRRAELPVTAKDGELMLDIDTARLPGGPALYFELAEK